ncbi:hypothetical protein AAG570_003211, partial [Ranatra chinensis]
VHILNNLDPEYYAVAVTGLGPQGAGYNDAESLNECKENIRVMAAVGSMALQEMNVPEVHVDGVTCPEAAAEGALLATWRYDEFRNETDRDTKVDVRLYGVRDFEWIEKQNMMAFMTVAKGSKEEPRFLEISYCGGSEDDKPIVLVGKGQTFDCGGLSLRQCKGMMEYKADMGGASVIVGAVKAAAEMQLPMNIIGLIPLCENMPSGSSMKPSDVLLGAQGKTVRVHDISKEGRLAISDAVHYSANFKPCLLVTIATMTEGIREALGAASSGVFTASDLVWEELRKAGAETGYDSIDLDNIGNTRGGDPCVGAAFLREFVPPIDWVHMDITGVGMWSTGHGYPYLRRGAMTGRPTRTLVQFLNQMACPNEKGSPC